MCVCKGNSSSWDPVGATGVKEKSFVNDWEEGWKISCEKGERDKKESLIADSTFNHGRPAAIYHYINTQLRPHSSTLLSLYSIYVSVSLLSILNQRPSFIYHCSLPLSIHPSVFERSVSIFTSAVGF